MTTIEKIKAEIERLYNGEAPKHDQQCNFDDGYFTGIDAIAQFLDTLESEKPSSPTVEEPIDGVLYAAACGIKNATGKSERPNLLNEMVDYARKQAEELLVVIKKYDDYSDEQIEELRTHFIAMFLEGTDWQKEQMMKEAVEGVLVDNVDGTQEICLHGNRYGEKVRIIIVKEDEK